jgi:hypothetical protein
MSEKICLTPVRVQIPLQCGIVLKSWELVFGDDLITGRIFRGEIALDMPLNHFVAANGNASTVLRKFGWRFIVSLFDTPMLLLKSWSPKLTICMARQRYSSLSIIHCWIMFVLSAFVAFRGPLWWFRFPVPLENWRDGNDSIAVG